MKRLLIVAAGAIALTAGAAHAGGSGGCSYGKHLASEQAKAKSPVMAAVDEADALRIEKLKALEEQASADAVIQAPVIHN